MPREAKVRKVILTGLLAMSIGIGTAAAAEIVVNVAPPRAVVEHRPPAPGPHHIWIGGYHRWDGRAYVWEPGRWEVPPREHAVWVAPRWHHRGDHWIFEEGRWR
jgi:WXXGXW repeat (2 copies)